MALAVHYTVYRPDTGRIVGVVRMSFPDEDEPRCRADALLPWDDGDHAVTAAYSDPAVHFVGTLGGEPTVLDRPALLVQVDKATVASGGVDEAVLTGLPDPCTVTVDADDPDTETSVHEVAGGGFVFTAADPGTYSVTVEHWPFLPFRIEFTAT